ncbi:MAG TPA: MFS transporter [Woeseiaceae bacterium]|nr:MFS transporter [Woeseiaceae bacterium]
MRKRNFLNRQVVAWALYDCGNSAFALSVLAVLYPLFLGSYWSAGDEGSAVTARLSLTTAIASIVVAVLAPVLGAIADRGGYRKRFLFVLALMGALSTALLSLLGEGAWFAALFLFLLASVGFYSANVFYDSLIVDVTTPRYYSLVSSLGFSLGYIGSALLLVLHVWMLRTPGNFGFADANSVMQFTFVSVAVWWLVFAMPLMFLVRERKASLATGVNSVRSAYQGLMATLADIRRYRAVYLFLIAYWFYIDGVFTVISMAVNFGQRLGFSETDLVTALLITNFVGFPATLAYGYLGHRIGPKGALFVGLAVYIGVGCWAVVLTDVRQFYAMAITVGIVQGGVQGMSRSLYASLIPAGKSGEFFGFYNMMTKFAHVLGPLLVFMVTIVSDEPRYILIALLPLFIAGALILPRVREPAIVRAD